MIKFNNINIINHVINFTNTLLGFLVPNNGLEDLYNYFGLRN